MKAKNFIFVIAILGLLAASCSPQSIDDQTTKDDIKATTEIRKDEIIVPTHG